MYVYMFDIFKGIMKSQWRGAHIFYYYFTLLRETTQLNLLHRAKWSSHKYDMSVEAEVTTRAVSYCCHRDQDHRYLRSTGLYSLITCSHDSPIQ